MDDFQIMVMATRLLMFLFPFIFLPAQVLVNGEVTPSLIHRIEVIEQKHQLEVAKLNERIRMGEMEHSRNMAELNMRVKSLEERNEYLTSENDLNRNEIASLKKTVYGLGKLLMTTNMFMPSKAVRTKSKNLFEETITTETEKEDMVKHKDHRRASGTMHRRRAVGDAANIAFTTYLHHDLDSLGIGQIIIFDQVLLNDGNGYNNYSGTFTAPVTGVYSFTFAIGQRDKHETGACLYHNNICMAEVIIEGSFVYQDLTGSNTANLKLTRGDIVHVKETWARDAHVEGNSRQSTFSGFLIYPVEDPVTVVGK